MTNKEKNITNQRVAGLIWKISDGVPLILTHQPTKSSSLEDYSVTTVTGSLNRRENGFTGITRIACEHLGIARANIIDERSMRTPMESLGKIYTWYLLQVKGDTKITYNPTEIQDYSWNPPSQLPHVIELMRAGRRHMFIHVLNEACKQSIISGKYFPYLEELVSHQPIKTLSMVT